MGWAGVCLAAGCKEPLVLRERAALGLGGRCPLCLSPHLSLQTFQFIQQQADRWLCTVCGQAPRVPAELLGVEVSLGFPVAWMLSPLP